CNGGLAGLAVADDELALPATDGGHRVDGLDAGLQRLLHRLAGHDVGGLQLEDAALGRLDVALAVERPSERVDDATEEGIADRDGQDLAGAPDLLALLDVRRVTEEHATDLADVEVQRETEDAAL